MSIETVDAPTTQPDPAAPAPQLPDLTGSWFFGPDTGITISLAGGHSIVVLPELPTGVYADTWQFDDADPNGSFERFKINRLAGHLVSWSLPIALPDDVGKRIEIVGKLGFSHLDRLYGVLDTYMDAHPIATIPIVPVKPLSPFETWFAAGDACVTLELPGNHTVRIRAELSALERAKQIASGEGRYAGIRKLAAYIVQWSMTYPNAHPVPIGKDSLREMPTSRFNVMLRTVEAYEKELAARDANPIGIGGSMSPSELLN